MTSPQFYAKLGKDLCSCQGIKKGSPVFGQLEKRNVGKKACGKKAVVVLAFRLLYKKA